MQNEYKCTDSYSIWIDNVFPPYVDMEMSVVFNGMLIYTSCRKQRSSSIDDNIESDNERSIASVAGIRDRWCPCVNRDILLLP